MVTLSQIFIVLRNSVKEQWEGEVKPAGKVCVVAKAAWQEAFVICPSWWECWGISIAENRNHSKSHRKVSDLCALEPDILKSGDGSMWVF